MSRVVRLKEYTTAKAVPLSPLERDAIRSLVKDLQISLSPGCSDEYDLRATSTIGVARIGDLTVEIAPRLDLDRVLFLVSYASEVMRWPASQVELAQAPTLVEAVALLFVRTVDKAIAKGLLQGYVHTEDRLTTIRGRIRFADQISRWNGEVPPVELAYDDFTADVIENRLLKAATRHLAYLGVRSPAARAGLQRLHHVLADISDVAFDPTFMPHLNWSRLNEHYEPAVELAKLVLSGGGLEATAGNRRAPALLFNMAEVFERFVHVALREALGLRPSSFPRNASGHRLRLDEGDQVVLKPDLSWWRQGECLFVGDCKYKRTDNAIENADLYQLLAYTVATDLPGGLLVYAAGEAVPTTHEVRLLGKRLQVRTLDLSGTPTDVLSQIHGLAVAVRDLTLIHV